MALTVPSSSAPVRPLTLRAAGLAVACALLAAGVLLSLAVGARSIAPGDVLSALLGTGSGPDAAVVRELRVPRTLLAICVGAGLGVSGALMQGLTRNPIADPGLLGVNAGASAAVVTAIALVGVSTPVGFLPFAFAGAAVATTLVYLVASAGRGGATPVRLALAGAALSAALGSYTYGISLTDPELAQDYNQWAVGTLGNRGWDQLAPVWPAVVLGLLVAAAIARPLNALALGDDTARALGAHAGRTRVAGGVAITLLCGAATAAAGPIAFVGLVVAHGARAICGPDQRWLIAYCAVLGPALVLLADVVGRVIVRPGELEVGLVLAIIGVPAFVALVRRRRVAGL
jgi:iron complex transport system permease protein